MTEKLNLGQNKSDYLAKVLKSTIGITPVFGGLINEIISDIIPNQRIDRIIKFLEILDKKLDELSQEHMKTFIHDEHFVSLFEDALIDITRAVTKERIEYIASIITNGIDSNKINFVESKHILKILNSINDIEILILLFKTPTTSDGDNKRSQLYPELREYEASYFDVNKYALYENYKDHLYSLGLLQKSYKWNSYDVADEKRTTPETVYSITNFGSFLLERIGFELKI